MRAEAGPRGLAAAAVEAALAAAEAAYRERHGGSAAAMARLARGLPGGDTRTTTWFDPFPVVIARADGAEMHDVDGHVLLDFLCNYTALVHGHRPPAVLAAIRAGLERGLAFAAPMREHGELAARLVARIPSVELVRFTNSGTEANLLAARIARAITGRVHVAVARHSYHGSYEALDWSRAGEHGTVVFDTGDIAATEAALGDGGDLAAVFVEPVLGSGGVISLEREYLEFLREYTADRSMLLVFDEVMTLRLDHGGRQRAVGVTPDLTTMAKLIGGGLPIGAVGGRADIMEATDPRRAGSLPHGGTFNGSLLAMVAGAATLDALDAPAIDRLNALGARVADGMRAAIAERDLPLSVTSCGSLLNVHGLPNVRTSEEAYAAAQLPLRRFLHLALLNEGIFIAPRGELCMSTAMDEAVVDKVGTAFGRVLDQLRTFVG